MSKLHESHRVYRALLYLYPKSHREAYGEQMIQTLEDILSEHQTRGERFALWVRIGTELPLNIIEENINNMGEIGMGKLSQISNKRLIIGAGVVAVAIALTIGIMVQSNGEYSPTTLSQVKHAATLPSCFQKANNPDVEVAAGDRTFIENSAATSIIDVAAGTNVDVYFKTYTSTSATGSSVYSGKFGSYNFTAKKTAGNSADSYMGGWKITKLEACQ